ncbi:MAG TPA: protoheme IX farnesyltransferase, partial [Verrucomicrobiales bacterium]|nr:protoheme IX farnesyltransferase [Verrucomicrobiales bacterium]
DFGLLLQVSLGTALLASGASVLNQLMEREFDARMRRTADRPLPSGRISPTGALLVGASLSVLGLAWLLIKVNPLTAILGATTWISYVAVYTPLKRITVLNTVVGAVPGALPPLMGWAAATNTVSAPGWALFGVLFFWQLPHFMAIAWLYRDDYAGAGFRMLSGVDPEGHRTAASAVRNTLALLGISLFPFLLEVAGPTYVVGTIVLGATFLMFACAFARSLTAPAARRLFFASILYLPLWLGLLIADKRTPPLELNGSPSLSSARVESTVVP